MEVLLLVFAACLGSGTWGQGQSSYEPEFLDSLENHTVTQGRDVSFTCVVNHLGQYKVAWIKSDSKTILAVHTHLVAHNNRLSVTHNGHNTWKLKVSNVQKNDSGSYMCQINTDPMKSQMGHLEVVIPPDVSDEDGGKDHETNEGGNIRLTCKATGIPEPKVVWRREDGKNIILRHEDQAKNSIRSFEGEMLHLTNVQRSDMGYYLCIASNGVPPTVSKRFNVKVHFHPIVKVSNQLVAAPIGSDVLIQCYVESSPKAMHSWTRENGDKLMDGSKYEISELAVNRYSHFMNLTIKDLTKKDFGSYACSSSNALGKAEGTIRLQELKLPKTTPTPQRKRPPGWKRQTTPRPWRTLEETRRRGEDSQPTSPQPPAAPTTSLSHHPPINESEEGDEENEIDSSASHLSQASLLILVALTLS